MFYPEGVYAAMLTPFTYEGTINEGEVRRMVDFAIDRGVDGLFAVSSVGEAIHLNPEEKVHLMQVVTEQANGRVKVTPGVGTTYPAQSIYLARKAKELGCDGVVAAPPYFYPITQGMIEKYFEEISDAVDIPIILYNVPIFTTEISGDVVERLSRRANIVGIKDSSGSMVDLMHFMDKVRLIGGKMAFLTGREDMFFPALMAGASGCMTATAGILPEMMVGIYRAWKAGAYDKARDMQNQILLLVRTMFSLPFPIGFKTALETRGFGMGPPKQPLSSVERSKYEETRRQLTKIIGSLVQQYDKGAVSKSARAQ